MEETLSPHQRDELYALFHLSVENQLKEVMLANLRRRRAEEAMRAMIDSENDSDSEEEMMELERLLRDMNKVASTGVRYILQNPGMDTFRPTEPLSPRKDTLFLLWPSKLVNKSFGKINLQL